MFVKELVAEIARVWGRMPVPSFVQLTNNHLPGATAKATLASKYHHDDWWLCTLFLNKRFDELDCSDRNLYLSDPWVVYMESYARWYYLGGYLHCA